MQENEKIIVVRKNGKPIIRTRWVWQYDVGHELQFVGFDGLLPETFQVHFATSMTGEATTQIGQNGVCRLPDMYTQTSGMVYAWVYVADAETGLTKQAIEIPVEGKGEASDQQPTPVEESVINQAIAALNSGVERAEAARREAVEAKEAAARSESNAEGWAAGTRDSAAVPDTDPAWHNNAKYYMEQAGESERHAGQAKEAAEEAARQAGTDANRAEQAANTAGFMEVSIDGNGHLIYLRTDQVDADFRLDGNGHLILMSA